ncbi:hypothetical protein UFOVP181_282 [uncultured Caudovirales phage]|uniref:Uncharacterized protein n=1 Tax=uncultured Caudovirales phage TaxID=2100421 RepID=A0A6J5KY68_9CAUD|nr:hypothetical protein UFOVP57_357 [uncultured Caudovirales phage]CAB5209003.1 hypothetical protein UFOVP181_282 [uncultured Caudovirales phage]
MSSREKDQADFDLEKFVDLFDTAMSSDNPTVQRALRNLLMIATMIDAENTDEAVRQGPLRRLVEDQRNIIRRLKDLENKQSWSTGPNTYPYIPPGTSNPNVPAGPYTITTPIPGQPWWGTGTGPTLYNGTGGTTTSTGYVAVNQGAVSGTINVSSDKYNTLLNTLETK